MLETGMMEVWHTKFDRKIEDNSEDGSCRGTNRNGNRMSMVTISEEKQPCDAAKADGQGAKITR